MAQHIPPETPNPDPYYIRGLFCDGCGIARSLAKCTSDECHIGLCVGDNSRTGCLNINEVGGRRWFCPKHNKNPVKLAYNINAIGRTGFLHAGRSLPPLLHLVVVPSEPGQHGDDVPLDLITAHLNTFYGYGAKEFLCKTSYFGLNGWSIHRFRETIKHWMEKYPKCSVLITIVGHSTVSTGELVYALPGAKRSKYTSVQEYLKVALGKDEYCLAIENNRGMKGIISTVCGYAYTNPNSQESWINLVSSSHFDWVLGFTARMLVPHIIAPFLPNFAEYAFLREINALHCLLGTSVHFLTDAVQRIFSGYDVMNLTNILLFYRPYPDASVMVQEYAHSSRARPWGFTLPGCPTCGNINVVAPIRQGSALARCLGCRRTAKHKVARPAGIIMVNEQLDIDDGGDTYLWKDFGGTNPWTGIQWHD